jgi:predicted alpha/beta superfamily hydrolase
MLFKFKKIYGREKFLKSRKQKSLNPLLNLQRLKLHSYLLDRKVKVDLYLPSDIADCRFTLFLNDGQDAGQLNLVATLTELFSKGGGIIRFAVVAIHANEYRMQEYGVAGHPDFKNRGNRATKYSDFVVRELTPFLQKEYGLMNEDHENVFAGFSMGGLSALDISWNHPELFSRVGVFSGSLWWRTMNTGTAKDDASRIMYRRLAESNKW